MIAVRSKPWVVLICAAHALLLASCSTTPPDYRGDLLGRTTGGREKSWCFESKEQFVSLNVLVRSNNVSTYAHTPKLGALEAARLRRDYVVLEMELKDRGPRSFYAQTLLTYRGPRLESVGLLGLEQLDPVR